MLTKEERALLESIPGWQEFCDQAYWDQLNRTTWVLYRKSVQVGLIEAGDIFVKENGEWTQLKKCRGLAKQKQAIIKALGIDPVELESD